MAVAGWGFCNIGYHGTLMVSRRAGMLDFMSHLQSVSCDRRPEHVKAPAYAKPFAADSAHAARSTLQLFLLLQSCPATRLASRLLLFTTHAAVFSRVREDGSVKEQQWYVSTLFSLSNPYPFFEDELRVAPIGQNYVDYTVSTKRTD